MAGATGLVYCRPKWGQNAGTDFEDAGQMFPVWNFEVSFWKYIAPAKTLWGLRTSLVNVFKTGGQKEPEEKNVAPMNGNALPFSPYMYTLWPKPCFFHNHALFRIVDAITDVAPTRTIRVGVPRGLCYWFEVPKLGCPQSHWSGGVQPIPEKAEKFPKSAIWQTKFCTLEVPDCRNTEMAQECPWKKNQWAIIAILTSLLSETQQTNWTWSLPVFIYVQWH